MVKKLTTYFLYTAVFLLALIYFVPKNSIYYFAEHELKKYDVVISNERLEDNLFTLKIKNMDIDVQGIETLSIDKSTIMLLVFYNSMTFNNIKLSSAMQAFLPVKIQKVSVVYTILDPFHVKAVAQGDFGKAESFVSLKEKRVKVVLHPSRSMLEHYRNSLRMFKKAKNGEYIYAQAF